MLREKRILRIGISEESPFIVYAMQSMLTAEFSPGVVCTYPTDRDDLLIRLKADPVDILTTDFSYGLDRDGLCEIKKTEELHLKFPEMKIILFTAQHRYSSLIKAMQAPANAVVSAHDNTQELIRAFHWVISANKRVFYSAEIQRIAEEALPASGDDILSPSEGEVIKLFAMGYNLTDIARLRKRSVSTVATQKYNAMRKLQLRSNTDLIKHAFAQGLI
ncbi:response regulator transcription factor [Erwinia sp. P6884]|uniref:response regulator transcription factor n=1 Tax=Erwinia sp. P6884 TaxID=3141450 RepID=UPI0031975E68